MGRIVNHRHFDDGPNFDSKDTLMWKRTLFWQTYSLESGRAHCFRRCIHFYLQQHTACDNVFTLMWIIIGNVPEVSDSSWTDAATGPWKVAERCWKGHRNVLEWCWKFSRIILEFDLLGNRSLKTTSNAVPSCTHPHPSPWLSSLQASLVQRSLRIVIIL